MALADDAEVSREIVDHEQSHIAQDNLDRIAISCPNKQHSKKETGIDVSCRDTDGYRFSDRTVGVVVVP
jgi:hypothetical protein